MFTIQFLLTYAMFCLDFCCYWLPGVELEGVPIRIDELKFGLYMFEDDGTLRILKLDALLCWSSGIYYFGICPIIPPLLPPNLGLKELEVEVPFLLLFDSIEKI